MDIRFSERALGIEEGIFSVLNTKKEELIKAGRTVYNFSVGTPDFKTPDHIMKAMQEACKDPENYKYALADRPEMLEAMRDFYQTRFGVELMTDQIMSMYGSQEGMAHIGLVLCDPGDVMLVPNPGYPVFGMGPQLMGAKVETYPLYKENNFIPDFNDIPEETARKAKFMIISYPANPVCSVADDDFYERAIAFAKKYDVVPVSYTHLDVYKRQVYKLPGIILLKNSIQNLMRHFFFTHKRQFFRAFSGDQGDYIGIGAETCTGGFQVICHNHIHILFRKLGSGIFQHMLRFHGEAAQKLTCLLYT